MSNAVVLTGPMGSGKTSVGKLLAAQLGWEFVDLDALIVEEAGMSINAIFGEYGEPYFRQLEQDQLKRLIGREQLVVSTGGGAVINPENRRLMRLIGRVVNLNAPLDQLVARLAAADDRPLLEGDEPRHVIISRLLAEREQYYADSDIRIDTAVKSVEDVAAELLKRLHKG